MSKQCGIASKPNCQSDAEWQVDVPDDPDMPLVEVCSDHVSWVLNWNGLPNVVTVLAVLQGEER